MTIFRVIDTETTGIPTQDDPQALVEVARCDVTTDGPFALVSAPQSRIVRPGRKIPPEAMAVHHITDAEAAEGITPDQACAWLADGLHAYTVSHNVDFDSQFVGSGVPWICTLKCAYRIWPDAPSHNNQVLRYFLNLDEHMDHQHTLPAHRAAPDAYVTAHLLAAILETGTPVEDLVKWSKGFPLLPRIKFGKHRGMKFSDAPTDYLVWLRDKSDMGADIKANARHWLKQRQKEFA